MRNSSYRIPSPSAFVRPLRLLTQSGQPRRIGVELEFSGLDIECVAKLVCQQFGGKIAKKSAFEIEIQDTRRGVFVVSFDAQFLKKEKHLSFFDRLGLDVKDSKLANLLTDGAEFFAEAVVPCEITAPPIQLNDLPELEILRRKLVNAGAKGTGASPFYAFGLHLNVEAPDLKTVTLLAYTRAFVLLWDWLIKDIDPDLSRRIGSYIEPFPKTYRERILDPQYSPSFDEFLADYVSMNPTRNRALDLLPILAERDKEAVESKVQEPELVSARPAFHYRLPNCEVDDPTWSIAREWARWAEVERLAAHPERLRKICWAYRRLIRKEGASFDKLLAA